MGVAAIVETNHFSFFALSAIHLIVPIQPRGIEDLSFRTQTVFSPQDDIRQILYPIVANAEIDTTKSRSSQVSEIDAETVLQIAKQVIETLRPTLINQAPAIPQSQGPQSSQRPARQSPVIACRIFDS